jgi:hypothetical protein
MKRINKINRGVFYTIFLFILCISTGFTYGAPILFLPGALVLNVFHIIKYYQKPRFYWNTLLYHVIVYVTISTIVLLGIISQNSFRATKFINILLEFSGIFLFFFFYFSVTYYVILLLRKLFKRKVRTRGVEENLEDLAKNRFLQYVPEFNDEDNIVFAEQAWLYWRNGTEEDWELLVEMFKLNQFDITLLKKIKEND